MRVGLIMVALIIFIGCFNIMSPALAQEYNDNNAIKKISTHGDWTSYFSQEDNALVCFMASVPVKAEGNYKIRGEIHALVTHRPALDSKNVVSFVAGYAYKENSEVSVNIVRKKFKFFTQGERAWLSKEADDNRFVNAMKRGTKMTVKGRSSRGTLTTDTYSLMGFTAAYKEISLKCG